MNTSYTRIYSSIYRGIVEDNNDPINLGRCKIRVPSVHGELTYPIDVLPWARPIALSPVNQDRGSVNIPDIGDIVWVLFEGSIKDYPVYFGGTYSTEDISIDKSIVNFYLDKNTELSYDRDQKKYFLFIGDTELILSHEGIHIKGNISIEGTATVDNLIINGSCNKED